MILIGGLQHVFLHHPAWSDVTNYMLQENDDKDKHIKLTRTKSRSVN